MTENVLSVEVTAPVSEALRLFAAYPVHHLPVVRDRTLVGMLSSADLLKLEGFLPKTGRPVHEYLDQRFRIETLMRRPAISIHTHASAEEAARLMVSHAIHALPVVDDHDHLLGILTTTDIMNGLLSAAPRHGDDSSSSTNESATAYLKPTAAEFAQSLAAARTAEVQQRDPDGIARSLLYLHQRVAVLEDVLKMLNRYLTAGQDESLHASLLKAVERAAQLEEQATLRPTETLGLGSA